MEALICPVLTSFVTGVLTRSKSNFINRDYLTELATIRVMAERTPVECETVYLRALRAFELAYASVLSVDLRELMRLPEPRASPETLDLFVDQLRVHVDGATIFNVELSLGEPEELMGPKQMKRTEMQRLHRGGLLLLESVEPLRTSLLRGHWSSLREMGHVLSTICRDMAIGLSKQVLFAEHLQGVIDERNREGAEAPGGGAPSAILQATRGGR